MANKRIKDLSTTAAVTASDDFIAVDGATNGTRKLDAYSPTFGGNLTVSGTGGFGGSTGPHTFGNGGGAVEVRAVGDSSGYYGYALYTGGSYESSLKHSASTAITKLDVGRNSAWGGAFEIYADTTRAARFAKTSTTLDGNLTVSGTGTTALGGAGSIISLSASGRLQLGFTYSRVADPDGAGGWLGGYNIKFSTSPKYDATGATAGLYYSSNGVRIYSGGTAVADTAAPLVATFATTGNLLIGTTSDTGEKLQVNGTGYFAGALLQLGNGSNDALYRVSASNGKSSDFGDDTTGGFVRANNSQSLRFITAGNIVLTLDSSANATFAGAVKIANTAQINGVYTTTTTFDFGTIANNDASSVCTLTMTGVSSSDSIIVSPTDGDNFPQFCTVSAVPSGNSVSVRLYNGSGSSRTVGSRSIRVTAIKF